MTLKESIGKYYIGFDIGSDTVHAVVLDEKGHIAYSPESLMHFGNPTDALKEVYENIINILGEENIKTVAFTGSIGKLIAEKTNSPFYYDTISIPAGAEVIVPEAEYIFHMGSKDPYFFEREVDKDTWKVFVSDHGTGTKCGGGSGILINKQIRRFFAEDFPIKLQSLNSTEKIQEKERIKRENRKKMQEQVEQMHKKALSNILKSSKNLDVGGRCGVVIQSDMIHLQNSGEQIPDILKGMYVRISKNYKCDVIKTRRLNKNKQAITTGDVFLNEFMIDALSKQLGIKMKQNLDSLLCSKIGAAGAALKALKEKKESKFNLEDLNSVIEAQKQEIQFAPPLSSVLNKVNVYPEEKAIKKTENGLIVYKELKSLTEVVIGVDGGSTTAKAIIADVSNLNIIAEICLDTDGRPLETAQKIFREIRQYFGNILKIKGIAYTGSSGAFYHKLFTNFKKFPNIASVDIVKDEITCHAYGVKRFNPKVDTIFECGGQDAKFTVFNKDGTVKRAKMNLSCMAGTGQSMKNMLDTVGMDFNDCKKYALSAKRTPQVDETCAIFTEAGILKLVALGFSKEEIAAAIVYGFMGGYVNKFVGNEKFGKIASAQGGPFKGDACLAVLALHTRIKIHAFPHRQLFGALGAAIAVHNEIKNLDKKGIKYLCKFRGLDIADMKFEKKVVNCSSVVKDSCGLRDCKLQVYKIGDDIIYSGGLCPKGNTDVSIKRAPNYIEIYKKILDKHLTKFVKSFIDSNKNYDKERILIPRSLTFLNEKGVFYSALYNSFGFDIAVSPESDDKIANQGISYSHSETCYPIKLAHGHAAFLKEYLRKGKDKILLVNVIGADKEKYKFCPYVAGHGFLVKDALNIDNKDALLPVFHFNDPDYRLENAVKKDLNRVFGKRFSLKEIKKGVKKAEKAEEEFLDEIHSTGERIVNTLKEKGEKVFIGIGRGYTILDDKASSKVHELFALYGLHFIPSFFLKEPDYNISDIVDNMYWYQGQSMLKYNLLVAMDPKLYPVRETNFNCGTDSIILYHEEDIMNKAEKPCLVLQTDGHNSNAQFGTRTLANSEVVKNHKPKKVKLNDFKKRTPKTVLRKIIGIPYMGNNSYAFAAAFRALGYNAEVMPTRTKESQEFTRRFISTNICQPFSFQVGDALAWLHRLQDKGITPNKEAAIFEPKAKGPCRFGQYSVLLRKFFDESGFNKVPIISPDADEDYTNLPISKIELLKISTLAYKGIFCNDILYDALLRTRPYEKENGTSEKEYTNLRKELDKLLERNVKTKQFIDFMKNVKKRFEALIDTKKKRKPIVVINGEIFVRCHEKANQNSIKLLEKYGLEVVLSQVSQWIDYTNKCSIELYKNSKKWKQLTISLMKKWYMKNISAKLHAPFNDFLKGREPHDPAHIMEIVQKTLIYEKLIGGEALLSIGETYLFTRGDLPEICGIYHIGPFGCMQETVATSKINALIQQARNETKEINSKIIPFMDAVFGDSELPNLEAEIAAFAEKCYLKKKFNKIKAS